MKDLYIDENGDYQECRPEDYQYVGEDSDNQQIFFNKKTGEYLPN